MKNPKDLDIAPAHMVGGMRVRQPDVNRAPLREEQQQDNMAIEGEEEEGRVLNTNEEDAEKERIRALQERQAQDMQAHTASRQPDITKNAGNNVQHTHIPAFQPRSMNH
jgi:hypothetical protein